MSYLLGSFVMFTLGKQCLHVILASGYQKVLATSLSSPGCVLKRFDEIEKVWSQIHELMKRVGNGCQPYF